MMRKLIVIILLVLFSQSKSYACSILKVDIGSSIDVASQNFDFLENEFKTKFSDLNTTSSGSKKKFLLIITFSLFFTICQEVPRVSLIKILRLKTQLSFFALLDMWH